MWRTLGKNSFHFLVFIFAPCMHLLMLNIDIRHLYLIFYLELTGHRSVGLRLVEDGPNLHPNPNPRYPSVKLCTPTTHRTPMSSASMPTMSSTSSKRVSLGSKRGDFCFLWIYSVEPCCCVCSDASGWWTGRLRGKQGLFPNNYVTKI